MTHGHSPALEQALAAFRAPGLFLRLRSRPFPDDLLLLLRIAAGDAQALELACAASGESAAVVTEAAVLFIQQLMFCPGSDSYRVLGVSAQAADSQIKEHYRWLVRWLHPDRNVDEWDTVYADRVNIAWQDLRTPERRRDFEQRTLDDSSSQWLVDAPTRPVAARAELRRPSDEFLLSARTVRRLPMLVLFSLTAVAAVVLGLQYYVTLPEAEPPVERQVATASTLTEGDRTAAMAREPTPLEVSTAQVPMPKLMPTPTPMPMHMPTPMPASPVAETRSRQMDPGKPVATVPLPRASADPARTPVRLAAASTAVVPPRTVLKTPAPAPAAREESALPAAPALAQKAPADAGVGVAAMPTVPALINETIAKDVILRFRSAYASGNINQVRSLLSNDSSGRSSDREAILRSYGVLFKSSASRHMEIRNASWLTDSDTAILIASYEAWIVPRGQSQGRRVTGDIRFDLRSENGELRIVRLRHDAKGS